jgi:hypothetical protein
VLGGEAPRDVAVKLKLFDKAENAELLDKPRNVVLPALPETLREMEDPSASR